MSNAVALYADVPEALDGDGPKGARPVYGLCSDGIAIFYPGQVNVLFGDPESGKTMLALAIAAAVLNAGARVAMIDLDHNGIHAILDRLIDLGADEDSLRTLERFRYVDPEDGQTVLEVVDDLKVWGAQFVLVDSIGELVPAFGRASNSPDDYTRVHRLVLTPLAKSGACVVAIDHLAKNAESRAMGATGTAAKKRAIGGTMLRVTVADAFTPGKGGAARTAGRDESTRTSLRIADELMRERLGRRLIPTNPEPVHEPVVIASLWGGAGIAYVKLVPRDRSTTFRWGRNYWRCYSCGDLDGFTCDHGLRIPDSRALRQAERARGITRTPKRKRSK